jgi:hypothetical protein
MSEQLDATSTDRFVWVFPLRKKPASAEPADAEEPVSHLPYGVYAVVSSDLTDEKRALVDEALDKLKEADVPVLDLRDLDQRRYEKMLGQWYEAVLDLVRSKIKELKAGKRRAAKAAGREFALVDDELRVNSASTEAELRATLAFLDYDESVAQEQLFEEARQAVPMPDPPKILAGHERRRIGRARAEGKLRSSRLFRLYVIDRNRAGRIRLQGSICNQGLGCYLALTSFGRALRARQAFSFKRTISPACSSRCGIG